MRRRLGTLLQLKLSTLFVIEAALIGTFFVQALRFLIGTLYARIGSASLYPALDPSLIDPNLVGLVTPGTVSGEISFLVYMAALPLITALIGRVRWLVFLSAIIAAGGRYLMMGEISGISPTIGAAITVGGGMFYIAMLVRHRAQSLPYMFIIAFSVDQIFRAFGNTLDPSWSNEYASAQLILTFITIILAFYTVIRQQVEESSSSGSISPDRGLLTIWGSIGLGGLLFLELSLLSVSNAIIGRAGYSAFTPYPYLTPILVVVTLLPLIPAIRALAGQFIGIFDNNVRGWVWLLLVALLIVLGVRVGGVLALASMVMAQFCVSLIWWWLVRPMGEKERNLTGLWIVLAMLVFVILAVFDIFTFEYAFVRDFAPEVDFLNPIIPPLLRGFRGLGVAVLLFSVLIAVLPMVQVRKRIPWRAGSTSEGIFWFVMLIVAGIITGIAARPPQIVQSREELRVGTYNIHAGFNEFYHYDLEAIAQTIRSSGVNVLLLQEVETGRLTSFSTDQVLWLARRVGMDARFFATNEGLQGLAVLSNIEIVFDDGELLDSVGTQTGLQRVQVRPDQNVITIYNTWLGVLLETDAERDVLEQETDQQNQLSEIFSIITAQNGEGLGRSRTIIGGTFNNVPDSDLISRLRDSGLIDPFAGLPVTEYATYWRTGQRARLDYLWLTPQLPAVGALVINSNASDHRMAVVGIELP
ncbi:MAG: endonuclease/exonuclease/phosphatase family protein [Aggregatilineales bacterium]